MKFSIKDTANFALRYPLEYGWSMAQAVLFSAAALVLLHFFINSGVGIFDQVPFKDFVIRGGALSSVYAISLPFAIIILAPLSVAIVRNCFRGDTYNSGFLTMEMAMQSLWYLVAMGLFLIACFGPVMFAKSVEASFPDAGFLTYLMVSLPATATGVFFMTMFVFMPVRSVLGHHFDFKDNIELTRSHLFNIFIFLIVFMIGIMAVRIPIHMLASLLFSALPSFFIVVFSTIFLAFIDIISIMVIVAATCHFYAGLSGAELKPGQSDDPIEIPDVKMPKFKQNSSTDKSNGKQSTATAATKSKVMDTDKSAAGKSKKTDQPDSMSISKSFSTSINNEKASPKVEADEFGSDVIR